MTDRLTLTRALEDSGMQTEAAERIATRIYDAIHNNVATKTDLREMEQPLNLRFTRLDLRFSQLDHRIDVSERRLVTRLGSLIVVGLGLLFAAVHYIPPNPSGGGVSGNAVAPAGGSDGNP